MSTPIMSMTGFGRATALLDQRTLNVEIRSLNHRGLDVKLRAYDVMLSPEIETEAIRVVRKSIARGAIAITLRDDGGLGQSVVQDIGRVRQMYNALEALRVEMGLSGPLELAAVGPFLSGPRSASTNSAMGEISASAWEGLSLAIEKALSGMCSMREREGAAIRTDLEQRLATLRGLTAKIADLAAGVPARAARRLEERLAALLGSVAPIDSSRLVQEAALLAERFDVSEELVRLRAHFDHLTMLLEGNSKDAPGRRIDFLAQEIARELNTLGAKIQDAPILALVVDGKAELEKLREQAQNIE